MHILSKLPNGSPSAPKKGDLVFWAGTSPCIAAAVRLGESSAPSFNGGHVLGRRHWADDARQQDNMEQIFHDLTLYVQFNILPFTLQSRPQLFTTAPTLTLLLISPPFYFVAACGTSLDTPHNPRSEDALRPRCDHKHSFQRLLFSLLGSASMPFKHNSTCCKAIFPARRSSTTSTS